MDLGDCEFLLDGASEHSRQSSDRVVFAITLDVCLPALRCTLFSLRFKKLAWSAASLYQTLLTYESLQWISAISPWISRSLAPRLRNTPKRMWRDSRSPCSGWRWNGSPARQSTERWCLATFPTCSLLLQAGQQHIRPPGSPSRHLEPPEECISLMHPRAASLVRQSSREFAILFSLRSDLVISVFDRDERAPWAHTPTN
jgi:hypothetical protein